MVLPTNVAASYPDRSAGDTAHQAHHDEIHAAVNGLAATYVEETQKGAANGVATLDTAALLPEAQVPTRLTAAQLSGTYGAAATHLAPGTLAARPAANTVPAGTLYPATDTDIIYRSDGTSWATWATPASSDAVTCQAKRTTDIVLTADTVTIVPWTTEEYDTSGFHDNATNPSRFTVPAGLGGKYRVTSVLQYSYNTTGISRQVRLNKNGTLVTYRTLQPGVEIVELAHELALVDGDYIEIAGISEGSTGASDIRFNFSFLTLTRIGA